MSLIDVYIKKIEMPPHINGVTVPNSDGTFDVYINSIICEERQEKAKQHEIKHIMSDHFYNYDNISINEYEANNN